MSQKTYFVWLELWWTSGNF